MPQLKTRRYYADVSQTHKDLTNEKYRNLRRPKKVTFFCNGDKFFKGKLLFITPHRYLSFQDLLGDLTNKLPNSSSLPYGVRQIYTPACGRRVRDIEHLQDGKEYVCAGFESFKALKYGTQALDPWSTGKNISLSSLFILMAFEYSALLIVLRSARTLGRQCTSPWFICLSEFGKAHFF